MPTENINISDLKNPFGYNSPIQESRIRELLTGREDELKKISYELKQLSSHSASKNIAIIGERASGKTTLLNSIFLDAKELGHLPVRVVLNSGDAESPVRFWHKIVQCVVQEAFDSGSFQALEADNFRKAFNKSIQGETLSEELADFLLFKSPSILGEAIKSEKSTFNIPVELIKQDFQKIITESSKCLLILIDESQILQDSEVILQQYREIIGDASGCMGVLTGSGEFLENLRETHDGIARSTMQIQVRAFRSAADIGECIIRHLNSIQGYEPSKNPEDLGTVTGWEITDDSYVTEEISKDPLEHRSLRKAAMRLGHLTGGEPQKILHLCHIAFRRFQEETTTSFTINTDVIEEYLDQIMGEAQRIIPIVKRSEREQRKWLNVIGNGLGRTVEQISRAASLEFPEDNWDLKTTDQRISDLEALGMLRRKEDNVIDFNGDAMERAYVRIWADQRDERIRLREPRDAIEYFKEAVSNRIEAFTTPKVDGIDIAPVLMGNWQSRLDTKSAKHLRSLFEGLPLETQVDFDPEVLERAGQFIDMPEKADGALHKMVFEGLGWKTSREKYLISLFDEDELASVSFSDTAYFFCVEYRYEESDIVSFHQANLFPIEPSERRKEIFSLGSQLLEEDLERLTQSPVTIDLIEVNLVELFVYLLKNGFFKTKKSEGVLERLGRFFYMEEYMNVHLARSAFEQALSIEPDDTTYRNNVAYLSMQLEDYERAIELLEPLVDSQLSSVASLEDDEDGIALFIYNYALCLLMVGSINRSAEVFKKISDSHWDKFDAWTVFIPRLENGNLQLDEVRHSDVPASDEIQKLFTALLEELESK